MTPTLTIPDSTPTGDTVVAEDIRTSRFAARPHPTAGRRLAWT